MHTVKDTAKITTTLTFKTYKTATGNSDVHK